VSPALIASVAGVAAAVLVGTPAGLGVAAVGWTVIAVAALARRSAGATGGPPALRRSAGAAGGMPAVRRSAGATGGPPAMRRPAGGVSAARRWADATGGPPDVDLREAEGPAAVDRPAVGRRDGWSPLWWAGAVALAAVPLLRSADWIVWSSLAAAAALASLAAAGGTDARQVVTGLTRVGRLPGGLVEIAWPVVAARPGASWRPALQGAGIAALLLAVFVPLLASADAAFAHLLAEAVPDPQLDRPVLRVEAWLLVVAIGGALLRAGRAELPRAATPHRPRLDRLAWAPPLLALTVLFAAFVALQVTTLFAGHEHVLRTAGLTYAEYAREGFAQLLAVAALTLAVIAAAAHTARRTTAADERLLRVLLGCLCVLCLVVLASALLRLQVYEEAYGYTRARVTAQAAMLWVGGLFVLVLVAGAVRRTTWLPRAVVALSAGGLLAFAASNPDGRVAAHNVERYERSGRIDPGVLEQLSADAAPALAGLPPRLAACVTARTRRELAQSDGPAGFSVARSRARAALADLPAEGSCLAPGRG
jgi:Domain of unknown function (DUF4173)